MDKTHFLRLLLAIRISPNWAFQASTTDALLSQP